MHVLFKTLVLAMVLVTLPLQAAEMHSTAVFYAADLPIDLLGKFQRVIVEADNVKPTELQALHQAGVKVLAYVSIGEVAPSRKWYAQVKPEWILGKNRVWDSEVMDIANPGWQQFVIEQLVAPLAKQGYDGLFMDTLDSFQLLAKTDEARQQQANALADLLRNIRKEYPQIKLVANRGFDVMPQIAPLLDAVLAESLYASWDNAHQEFKPATPSDTEWLLQKLKGIQQEFGLEIIILDYLPPTQVVEARQLAKKIQEQGFVPWISTAALDGMGTGMVEVVPKTFLLLFDSAKDTATPLQSKYYQAVQQALEKRGYQLRLHDIQSGLPNAPLLGRYAGILSFLAFTDQPASYQIWLTQQQEKGVLIKSLRSEADIPTADKAGVK
ncbi:MAG: endo alpha-1,4 polygalactosaminidase [Thiothrix sp.]|uniref:endo alpha-1,4 polygalactosaminidase n=1 Tax=Thiothrix sp. TaxID=1032 RepID=UPI0026208F46|nr:endo alpha-1,4 polygalactosaminidase [Thiothrix sp.]MDD5392670.1 endo alpha-1,4 polygalactosaminidase [Thiothrix sp.]